MSFSTSLSIAIIEKALTLNQRTIGMQTVFDYKLHMLFEKIQTDGKLSGKVYR
jgi:hypothetical protein